MDSLQMRRIQDSDIPLLEKWLHKKHVNKWYHNPEEWLFEVKNRFDAFGFINHFIVTYQGKSIGFCQYYACIDSGEEWKGYHLSQGTYSIDYMIGEEEYLNKGFGKAIVGMLVEAVFSIDGVKEIIVSPEPENISSCKSLLANSFKYDTTYELYQKNKVSDETTIHKN